MEKYQGSCLCGQIKYEVSKIESQMGHCHCTMCRKFHGSAFATLGEAKSENFHWVSGEDQLSTFLAPNGTERKFCNHCGSSMIFVPSNDDGKLVEFALGTLDSKLDLRPDAHIYMDYTSSWYSCSDELPRFSEGRDSKKL